MHSVRFLWYGCYDASKKMLKLGLIFACLFVSFFLFSGSQCLAAWLLDMLLASIALDYVDNKLARDTS